MNRLHGWAFSAALILSAAGCGAGTTGDTDGGGGGIDGGGGSVDASSDPDARAAVDARVPIDAREAIDARGATDARVGPDARVRDAGIDSGAATFDAGGAPICTSTPDCEGVAYCRFIPRGCSGNGVCTAYGGDILCPGIFDPVCGCNGTTYSNACAAGAAGVNIASDGACPSCGAAPAACCYDDGACTGARCAREDCSASSPGTCVDPSVLTAGQCWEDEDCTGGATCEGESICACGLACFAPDSPGTCESPL